MPTLARAIQQERSKTHELDGELRRLRDAAEWVVRNPESRILRDKLRACLRRHKTCSCGHLLGRHHDLDGPCLVDGCECEVEGP